MKTSATGFTLIELMIVVAILGIMTSIALPYYSDYLNLAKNKAVHANLDEAIRYTRNQISLHVQDPQSITVASLLNSLNNTGIHNPCQPAFPAFIDAATIPQNSRCFVTLQLDPVSKSILIKGYDADGMPSTITSNIIHIE